jgi:hypothetical protein
MSSKRQETQRTRRKLHEQLRQFAFERLLRGSVVERRRRCGRGNCACRTDVEARHLEKVLSTSEGGKTVTLHLRPQDEERVRQAINAYHHAWAVVEALTACELADLRREAAERARSRRRRQTS